MLSPSTMPFLAVTLVTLSVVTCAWLIACRGYRNCPLEALIAAGVCTLGLICGPILLLGWMNALYANYLALLSLGCASLAALAALQPNPRAHLSHALKLSLVTAALPYRALRDMVKERSFVALGLVPVAAICAWTAWLSYLAPQTGWDGLWYHDPIVGFAIQHHGFSWLDVPHKLMLVNGYPKTSEMLGLWFCIFSNRSLIELPSSLLAPLSLASMYQVLRHCKVDKSIALALSMTYLLTPSYVLELRSTYVDAPFATVVAMALVFVMRPTLRRRDVLMAGLALGLLMGMKSTGLMLAPMFLAILALRAPASRKAVRFVPTWCAAVVLVLALGSPFYIRNYQRTHNPVFPAELKIKSLGINWEGMIRFPHEGHDEKRERMLRYTWPKSDRYYPDIRVHGYGKAFPWAIPLAALGALLLAVRLVTQRGFRRWSTANTLMLASTLSLTYLLSPATWWARLNLHCLIGYTILVGVGVDRLPKALRELLATASVAVSLAALYPLSSAWGVPPQVALALATLSHDERAVLQLSPQLPKAAMARAREYELGRGTVVAFGYPYIFPALLWNDRFDNRIVFVKERRDSAFVSQLDKVGARWVVVARGARQDKAIRKLGQRTWQRVGMMSPRHIVYRRKIEGRQEG